MLTMTPSPEATSLGRRARVMRSVPITLVSHIWRHLPSSASVSGSRPSAPPALFTSTRHEATAAQKPSTDPASATSSASGHAPGSSAARASRRSRRRAPSTTSNPAAARARAVAAPMPLEAPVTTAVPPGSNSAAMTHLHGSPVSTRRSGPAPGPSPQKGQHEVDEPDSRQRRDLVQREPGGGIGGVRGVEGAPQRAGDLGGLVDHTQDVSRLAPRRLLGGEPVGEDAHHRADPGGEAGLLVELAPRGLLGRLTPLHRAPGHRPAPVVRVVSRRREPGEQEAAGVVAAEDVGGGSPPARLGPALGVHPPILPGPGRRRR